MKPPNNAPVYAAIYAELAEVFRDSGYALAIHGTLARDFDLIAVPWAEVCHSPHYVLEKVTTIFAVSVVGGATVKEHGRVAWSISIGHGECAIDLSFMPVVGLASPQWRPEHENG